MTDWLTSLPEHLVTLKKPGPTWTPCAQCLHQGPSDHPWPWHGGTFGKGQAPATCSATPANQICVTGQFCVLLILKEQVDMYWKSIFDPSSHQNCLGSVQHLHLPRIFSDNLISELKCFETCRTMHFFIRTIFYAYKTQVLGSKLWDLDRNRLTYCTSSVYLLRASIFVRGLAWSWQLSLPFVGDHY